MTVVRRCRKQVPGYRLHRPSGQAVVTLSGTDFYLGPHGTQISRNEYDRVIAEWLAKGRRLAVPAAEQNPLTISELLLAYWRHVTAYYVKRGAPTSEQHVIRSALRPVRQLYGTTEAQNFSPLALKAVREQYIAAGVARSTVNRYAGHVVRMFRWAVENELVPAATHHALRTVTGLRKGRSSAPETKKVRPVPDAFVEAVRPYVSRQVWAMIVIQQLTAMRPSEVVSMRTGDLGMGGEVWVYRPRDHKTEHHDLEREVWIGPQAQEILRSWLQTELNRPLFSPTDAESERRVEQRRRRNSPMTPSQAARRPRRAAGPCLESRGVTHVGIFRSQCR
jgi:integrase